MFARRSLLLSPALALPLAGAAPASGALGTAYVGQERVNVLSYPGASAGEKFRAALAAYPTPGPGPALVIPPGTTLDAGASPFVVPPHVALIGAEGVETEFGRNCPVNLRATGGRAVG